MIDDPVNPNHYKRGEMESIDIIKMSMTPIEFIGYLRGNISKYNNRFQYKNKTTQGKIQDLDKLIWYAERIKEELRNIDFKDEPL
jgi:hypothetical protein|tara:strand:- start:7067 stop:7321 length:255 start_codon:yes stop_codon:yes gene_type:complete